jgi:uncharacterized protein
MTFLERIEQDLKTAMKAKMADRLSTLRMVKTAIKNREIAKMAPVSDDEAMQVLQTLVKQRRDSIEMFQKGGRVELAEKEAAEITVIEEYLPAAVSEEEIKQAVDDVVRETNATAVKEMGATMKLVMARLAGKMVDGKVVNQLVRARLGS